MGGGVGCGVAGARVRGASGNRAVYEPRAAGGA